MALRLQLYADQTLARVIFIDGIVEVRQQIQLPQHDQSERGQDAPPQLLPAV